MKGGSKVIVEEHRHKGIYVVRGKTDVLATRNMIPGESVYGEKRISVEEEGQKVRDLFHYHLATESFLLELV